MLFALRALFALRRYLASPLFALRRYLRFAVIDVIDVINVIDASRVKITQTINYKLNYKLNISFLNFRAD
jgi:hypothetical protein